MFSSSSFTSFISSSYFSLICPMITSFPLPPPPPSQFFFSFLAPPVCKYDIKSDTTITTTTTTRHWNITTVFLYIRVLPRLNNHDDTKIERPGVMHTLRFTGEGLYRWGRHRWGWYKGEVKFAPCITPCLFQRVNGEICKEGIIAYNHLVFFTDGNDS